MTPDLIPVGPSHDKMRLTCQNHAHLEALLETAELAPIALRLGDFAVTICDTCVHPLVLHGPLEEALASEM